MLAKTGSAVRQAFPRDVPVKLFSCHPYTQSPSPYSPLFPVSLCPSTSRLVWCLLLGPCLLLDGQQPWDLGLTALCFALCRIWGAGACWRHGLRGDIGVVLGCKHFQVGAQKVYSSIPEFLFWLLSTDIDEKLLSWQRQEAFNMKTVKLLSQFKANMRSG